MVDARTWLIRPTAPFPVEIAMPPGGGMPEKLEPVSRIESAARNVAGRPLIFERGEDWPEGLADFTVEPAEIALRVDADTPADAPPSWSAI